MTEHTHENSLPLGSMLSKYKISSLLGHGGFGITYKAKDTTLDRDVAIKEYLPQELVVRRPESSKVTAKSNSDQVSYEFGLQRFLEETRTLASFQHHNIVRVLDFFEANNTAYMVMEFEEGISLGDQLDELPANQPLPFSDVEGWLDGLLNGLFAVHNKGILHRDIKPDNIYIRKNGSAMLIDFGTARYALGDRSKSLSVVLTPGYAPNEQYSGQGKQGPYTDIYALGGVLYRCATGRNPVDAPERMQSVFAEGGEDPQQPSRAIGKNWPINFFTAIDAAMCIRPMDRPSGVPQFRELLAEKAKLQSEPERPETFGQPQVQESPVLRGEDNPHEQKQQPAKISLLQNKKHLYVLAGWVAVIISLVIFLLFRYFLGFRLVLPKDQMAAAVSPSASAPVKQVVAASETAAPALIISKSNTTPKTALDLSMLVTVANQIAVNNRRLEAGKRILSRTKELLKLSPDDTLYKEQHILAERQNDQLRSGNEQKFATYIDALGASCAENTDHIQSSLTEQLKSGVIEDRARLGDTILRHRSTYCRDHSYSRSWAKEL